MQLTEEQIERFRQSGIKLDREGRFWHEGGEVTHAGLRAALWRWLDRNPDGRYVLRLDEKRFVWLDVDDVPFVVRSLRWQDGDRVIVRLSDDSEEELDYGSLKLRAGGEPYCRVKGRFDARLSTAAWSALGSHIDDGQLQAAGRRWPLQ